MVLVDLDPLANNILMIFFRISFFYLMSVTFFLSLALSLKSALDWWPKIDAVYCYSGELRSMFAETLKIVMQLHTAIRLTPVTFVI